MTGRIGGNTRAPASLRDVEFAGHSMIDPKGAPLSVNDPPPVIAHDLVGRAQALISDLQEARAQAASPDRARTLSVAITHFEDGLLRLGAPPSLLPVNEGGHTPRRSD